MSNQLNSLDNPNHLFLERSRQKLRNGLENVTMP